MTIYFITIIILFILSLIDINYNISSSTRKWMMIFMYLFLVLQVGFRWETGTDWDSYLDHFKSITDFASISPLGNGMEFGYNLFVFACKSLVDNYSFFLVIHALLYYFLIFISFKRYSPYFFISALLFYTFSMGMMGSNRQLIAFAICLYALKFAFERKPIQFFTLLLIAVNFHTSAFLFAIFYFLDRPMNLYTLFLILFVTFIIGKTRVPFLIFSFIGNLIGGNAADKAFIYLSNVSDVLQKDKLSFVGLLKRLLFLGIFFYNRNKLREAIPYYTLLLNGYIIGIAFYFLFADSLLIMVNRGSFYFNMMEPLLLAAQISLFRGNLFKSIITIALLLFSILYLFQSIAGYPDLFDPYKGLFINTNYSRVMY